VSEEREVHCPFCFSECRLELDDNLRRYWQCQDKECQAYGPINDPTGAKFTAPTRSFVDQEKRIAELEEKNLRMSEQLALYERTLDMDCGMTDLASMQRTRDATSKKRDERLRVAAMMLQGIVSSSGLFENTPEPYRMSVYMADELIAEIDKRKKEN